jgi:hypothetical protein
MHVPTVTQPAVESVLSAVGQDGISRALPAPYVMPLATVIHAEARAALIPTPAASSRIGLLDFSVCGERFIAANQYPLRRLAGSVLKIAPHLLWMLLIFRLARDIGNKQAGLGYQ